MIHVFTSAALNYLPKVLALFKSVRRHHPEFVCHFLVTESAAAIEASRLAPCHDLGIRVTFVTDLGVGRDRSWVFRHSLVELATALKPPFAVALMARQDCDHVIYLDPDIVVFSRLDDILASLDKTPIALTPHMLHPETNPDAVVDNELVALRHGVFNLGFFGLRKSKEAQAFASWWAARTHRYCIDRVEAGLFTDQKWIDLAPGFFEVGILRSPRFNVAPWNLSQRGVRGSFEAGFTVDGEPLGFYHFTGFDSGAHRILAEKYAGSSRAVQTLIDWYERYTAALTSEPHLPWSLGSYDTGAPILTVHRRIYAQRADLQDAYPDPFAAPYVAWLTDSGREEYPQLLGERAPSCPPNATVPPEQGN